MIMSGKSRIQIFAQQMQFPMHRHINILPADQELNSIWQYAELLCQFDIPGSLGGHMARTDSKSNFPARE